MKNNVRSNLLVMRKKLEKKFSMTLWASFCHVLSRGIYFKRLTDCRALCLQKKKQQKKKKKKNAKPLHFHAVIETGNEEIHLVIPKVLKFFDDIMFD